MQGHLHVHKVMPTAGWPAGGPGSAPGGASRSAIEGSARTPLPQVRQRLNGHANSKCAPGRTRTDTSDPFRGAASALGLRGLANNTPQFFIIEGLSYSDRQVSRSRFIQFAITACRVQRVTISAREINTA